MSGRKPTLGYPSRTAAVLALRQQHLTTAAIAARIGVDNKTIIAFEISAAKSRGLAETGHRTILFPPDLLRRLSSPAGHRGITVNELARRIVETVIDDGLLDAVLDDREALPS